MNAIDSLVNNILTGSDRTLNERMVRNQVHWGIAILANRLRRRIRLGRMNIIPNYYGIAFSGSNSGKSYSFNKVHNGFSDKKWLDNLYKNYFKEAKRDMAATENENYIRATLAMSKESTRQGVHKVAEAISFASAIGGSLNIYTDEMFSDMNEPLMDMLLSGYDGNMAAPTIKGDGETESYVDVFDLPVNFTGLSSLEPLYRSNNISEFISRLRGGWFRRAFIIDATKHTIQHQESIYIEPIEWKELARKDIEPGFFYLNSEAEQVFGSMRKDMINESTVEYGELRDPYKILSLAALHAYGDRRLEINAEDVMYAQQFEIQCFKDASNFCEMEHDFVRAFHELSRIKKSENELIRAKLLPKVVRDRQTVLNDLRAYCIENNAQLNYAFANGIKKYFVTQFRKNDMVCFSYADWNGQKAQGTPSYKELYEGRFEDIPDFIQNQNTGIQLTICKLNDKIIEGRGYTNRIKENVISTDIIVFDIDNIEPDKVGEIKEIFDGYEYIVRHSSSHTAEKPKFHIFMKLAYRIHLNHDEYKDFYARIVNKLGLDGIVDMSMAKLVQPVYELRNRKTSYFKGKEFDPRCCISNTYESEQTDETNHRLSESEFISLRLKRYLQKVIDSILSGADRDNTINAFVHQAKEVIKADSRAIKEALDILFGLPQFDTTFTKQQKDKFYKRIH